MLMVSIFLARRIEVKIEHLDTEALHANPCETEW